MSKIPMLRSKAGRDRLYELQQTVTIMQQRFQPVKGTVPWLRVGRLQCGGLARESLAIANCRKLGQTLALFRHLRWRLN
jgi:hypothetical protein